MILSRTTMGMPSAVNFSASVCVAPKSDDKGDVLEFLVRLHGHVPVLAAPFECLADGGIVPTFALSLTPFQTLTFPTESSPALEPNASQFANKRTGGSTL